MHERWQRDDVVNVLYDIRDESRGIMPGYYFALDDNVKRALDDNGMSLSQIAMRVEPTCVIETTDDPAGDGGSREPVTLILLSSAAAAAALAWSIAQVVEAVRGPLILTQRELRPVLVDGKPAQTNDGRAILYWHETHRVEAVERSHVRIQGEASPTHGVQIRLESQ